VNVREEPRPDSPAFVTLRKGREVTVEKVIGDWALITLDSGRKGYVRAVFLNLPRGVESVAGQTPDRQWIARLDEVSGKFRELTERAGATAPAAAPPPPPPPQPIAT